MHPYKKFWTLSLLANFTEIHCIVFGEDAKWNLLIFSEDWDMHNAFAVLIFHITYPCFGIKLNWYPGDFPFLREFT